MINVPVMKFLVKYFELLSVKFSVRIRRAAAFNASLY